MSLMHGTNIKITTVNFEHEIKRENVCARATFVACQRNVTNEIFNSNLAVCKPNTQTL